MKRYVLIAAVVVVAVGASVAYASVPGGNGVIHGCYQQNSYGLPNPQTGLRVIDAARQNCKAGEVALNWNQTGPQGPSGPQGASGVNSPLVYTYTGTSGPDSSSCSGNWATDTYTATFVVQSQADGSYVVFKYVDGSFVTIAGTPQPNPASCPGPDQTGGVNGTFYGTEAFTVAADTDFNPGASCGAACSPTTTSTSSSTAQNDAFVAAFFPEASGYSLNDFDFVYDAGANGNWIDSNSTNSGNITG